MVDTEVLFPNFIRMVESSRLSQAKGSLAAKLPRILGQGTTRADGMTRAACRDRAETGTGRT